MTLYDNVELQRRLVTDHLGIEHLRLVVGFSVGAQQAFHWGSLFPDMVDAIAPICGSARTSVHNYLLLDGAKAALRAGPDFNQGRYASPAVTSIQAFCRVFCSLVFSAEFYRKEEYAKLGLGSPAETMNFFEGFFQQRDANDLLAMLWAWQNGDISTTPAFQGDLAAALGAIKARAIVMPSQSDFLFQVTESAAEAGLMPNAELRPIPSNWGHVAGFGANPPDNEFIDAALRELLAG